jgi:hypothetical protein
LPPKSYRRRHDPPEWEVSDDSGAVVGWIEERHLPTAGRPFFALAGVHPVTGERIELQLSADRDERLRVLARFLVDPDSCAQHFLIGTAARADWDARRPLKPWEMTGGRSGRHG